MDLLLYDQNVEETIDLFKDEKNFDSFLEYGGPLLKKGKQGLVGYLLNKNNNEKYVYKISQYLDYVVDQEYNVMKDLNTLRDFCPHFVKIYGKFKRPLTSNYRKSKNPFLENPEYKNVLGEVIVMQNLEGCKKFFKYIKSDLSTTELLSIVKQSLLASMMAFNKVKFTHYDLHSDNIMVKRCNENSVFLYIIDEKYYLVPTYGIYPIIIDFGFSYSKSSDNQQMNCSLGHTKYGFIQCMEDEQSDPKLFLCSVSKEIKKYKNDKNAQKFRNLVKNLYKKSHVDLDCGWDEYMETSVSDDFLDDFEKIFKKSHFFDEQQDYILDLLQTLVILPLKERKTTEKTKDLLSLVINEFLKIEKLIKDDFFNLFIFKEMISSTNKNRDLYTNQQTRQDAVSNFKYDVLNAVDMVAKFCNPKINWEKMLCSLLCLSKNIENFCYFGIQRVMKNKKKDYLKVPLQTSHEIFEAIESTVPSHFIFDKNTIIYEWNYDTENSKKRVLDHQLTLLLNKTIKNI